MFRRKWHGGRGWERFAEDRRRDGHGWRGPRSEWHEEQEGRQGPPTHHPHGEGSYDWHREQREHLRAWRHHGGPRHGRPFPPHEGRTPFQHPHRGHREGFGPRMWRWHARRGPFDGFGGPDGPFGPRGPFGPDGPFGHGGPGGPGGPGGKRFFGRGDLKFALLALLAERPMHGYEMMKALEEQSGGRYSASAGSVYPTLQLLEDRGFVTSATTDGKKVYTITEEGKAFAEEHRKEQEQRGPRHGRHGRHEHDADWADLAAMMQELREAGPVALQALQAARRDPAKRERLRALIDRLRGELSEIAAPDDRAPTTDL